MMTGLHIFDSHFGLHAGDLVMDGAKTYTVKKGDCLWNIAKQFYGKGSQYSKIFNANKGTIKNANLIYPGQVLTIPA